MAKKTPAAVPPAATASVTPAAEPATTPAAEPATTPAAEPATTPAAEAPVAAPKIAAPVEQAGVYVCEGCSVTSRRGVLGAGEMIREKDFPGDARRSVEALLAKKVLRVVG